MLKELVQKRVYRKGILKFKPFVARNLGAIFNAYLLVFCQIQGFTKSF